MAPHWITRSPFLSTRYTPLYDERDEAAAQTFCVKNRTIPSVYMTCGRLVRVVESQGTSVPQVGPARCRRHRP
jgi:hypothetical protein